MTRDRLPVPGLPVLGWNSFGGTADGGTPCMLDEPTRVYTTSGRASLLLAMEMLGVGPGVRVLVPTFHCPSVVAPVTQLGGEPVFYPIDAAGAPDLGWLRQSAPPDARAIIAAHFFGLPQPMEALRQWCDTNGVALVEDCAHALFGRSGSRAVGAWGDCAIASLPKFLPVPDGGLLIQRRAAAPVTLTACPPPAQLRSALNIVEAGARQRRLPGLNTLVCGLLDGVKRLRGGAPAPHEETPLLAPLPPEQDGDYRIDASLAHRQAATPVRWVAERLPRSRIVERRRLRYTQLADRLAGVEGARPLLPVLPADCAPYVFPLWVERPQAAYVEMRRRRLPVFRWDRVWPATPVIAGDHGLAWAHHVFQLACHQDLADEDFERYVLALRDVLTTHSGVSTRETTQGS